MSNEPHLTSPGEQSLPTSDSVPIPVWWLVALAALAFWGLGYLDHRGGGFDARVYEPFASFDNLPKAGGGDPRLELGARLYKEKGCVGCHMPNGLGNPSGNIPPLAGSDWVNAEGPNRIIRIVLHGFTGPVEVSGKQFNGATMTPMGAVFTSDEEIAAVLTYVRGNKEWGNAAAPVTQQQVTAIRGSTKDRNQNWTMDELKAIPVRD